MSELTSIAPPFTLPENPLPSARYRARFNETAKELGVNVEWVKDDANPLVVDAGEAKINGSVPESFNEAATKDVKRILDGVEKRRLGIVEASALFHKRLPYRAPLELLNKAERAAVEMFGKQVKPVLDRIEALQCDPNAEELSVWMAEHGDYYSKIMFGRFHRDTCAGGKYIQDQSCSLFPFYPDQPPINGMIDPKITMEQFQALGAKLPPEAPELRPTTILTLDKNGVISAMPLPFHPNFRSDHLLLAQALEKIADLYIDGNQLDPKLQDQLKKWAQFFRSGSALDEALAAQATIDAGSGGGMLRVHIGPSESYWDDNTKFPYLLQVGLRDPKLSAEMAKFAVYFPEIENSLSGIPHYIPRKLSIRGGFADAIYQAITGGFIQTYPGSEPAGNNFPNYSGYHVEGSNRFILLEGDEAKAPQIKALLSKVIDEDVSGWDAKGHWSKYVVNHESGHLLGPQRDHITPGGKTMGGIFGAHWGDADEPKADLTHAEMVLVRYRNKEITKEEMTAELRMLAADNFSRYKGKAAFLAGKTSLHSYGKVLAVGYFFSSGVYQMNNGKIHVDYEKMMSGADNLWRKIIAFQASGDLAGFLNMGKELVSAIPDDADKLLLEANLEVDKQFPIFFIERHL